MATCEVCHAEESREAIVDETFRINGKYVRVDHIPAIQAAVRAVTGGFTSGIALRPCHAKKSVRACWPPC